MVSQIHGVVIMFDCLTSKKKDIRATGMIQIPSAVLRNIFAMVLDKFLDCYCRFQNYDEQI